MLGGMSELPDETLAKQALQPQSVAVPGLSVTRHSLSDQIELDKYLARKRAAASRSLPIRIGKLRPPGAV